MLLYARNLDSLQKVANEIDEHTTGRIVIKTIDLEDLSLIDKLIDEIITEFGPVHILINNSGDHQAATA